MPASTPEPPIAAGPPREPAAPTSSDPTPDPTPGAPRDPATDTRSADDRDLGWGDDLDRADRGERDARWYEDQRPPHWE